MNINDEKLLEHYQNTIEEVKLSNDETHFNLSYHEHVLQN